MTHVDDLIKRRKQQVFLAIIPRLAHRIPQCRRRRQGITNRPKAKPKTQESEVQHPAFLQNRILHQDQFCLFLRSIRILHGGPNKASHFRVCNGGRRANAAYRPPYSAPVFVVTLRRLTNMAARHQVSRSEAIRRLVEMALKAKKAELR
ncbi:ribbon-helix-helix protein, CopG family [Bradyrhizobium sp. USDA 3315]